ncbi:MULTISPECIES: cache domain-containing protein [unclassified Nostoc]|uniref:cache domain-containing protein n=1 Tax=unclassified Nostoc TaxID=2593658 RepID=UPI002AD4159E|nr:cache domain-containing protein [Nostoc sp. DedQUE03]MDZ7971006.1 cache domain-containing protein [Nostoc sp. DedQUE03]MDZ8046819.1 cache domain-containing protein [Nostoc sp. DedQUE02]
MPSIRTTVPIAFLVPLLTCVGVLGTIALYTGYRNAEKFSHQSMEMMSARITENLKKYVETPHLINQINADAIVQDELNLNEPNKLERHFWYQAKVFKSVNGIQFGYETAGQLRSVVRDRSNKDELMFNVADASTNMTSVVYEADELGNRGKELGKPSKYDARTRQWYQTAVKARKPIWTEIFEKKTTQETQLRVSAVRPVYQHGSGKLQGVLAVDFFLTQIGEFLKKLSHGNSREIFIVERSGELIAASTESRIFDDNAKQIQATNFVQEPLIKATAEYVNKKYSGFSKIQEEQPFKFYSPKGEVEWVKIKPFQDKYGLNWLIVVVVPEKEFMEGFQRTRDVTIVIGLSALAFSLLLGLVVTRWLTKPILEMNDAAKQIASSEFDLNRLALIAKRSDEIGQLARVFQEMADIVYSREKTLKDRVQQLLSETDKAKKTALLKQMTGNVDFQELLMRSRSCREKTTFNTPNLSNLLHLVPSFQHLNSIQLQKLINIGHQNTLFIDTVIFHEDELNDKFYLIITGSVELYIEKLQKPLKILSAGDFFGEESLLSNTPQVATARTLEPTTLFMIDQHEWQTLFPHQKQLTNS